MLSPKRPISTRGWSLPKTSDFQNAAAAFTKAIELNEYVERSYFNRGLCYINMKDWKNAKQDFTKTIELASDFAPAYLYRAMANASSGELELALADLERTIILEPEAGRAFGLRGQIMLNKGEKDKACADFARAAELQDPVGIKMGQEYCGVAATVERLQLPWPNEEKWRVADHQENGQMDVVDFLRNDEALENWTEIGNITTIKGVSGVPVDTLMAYTYAQAVKTAPKSKLTFLERDLAGKNPWIMFKIESPEFTENPTPESQLWYVTASRGAVYTSFRAVKQASIPADIQSKWIAFSRAQKL